MKKTVFFFNAALLLFVIFSCNDHQSANPSNKTDASNATMDETGPSRDTKGDTAKGKAPVNQNEGTNGSTGTQSNAHKPGASNTGNQ
jgi:hypothetical protein